jgi:transposase
MGTERIEKSVTDRIWQRLTERNTTVRQVAREHGVSSASVQRIANGTHAGTKHLGKPRQSNPRNPIAKETVEAVKKKRLDGATIKELVEAFGISVSSAYRFIK